MFSKNLIWQVIKTKNESTRLGVHMNPQNPGGCLDREMMQRQALRRQRSGKPQIYASICM